MVEEGKKSPGHYIYGLGLLFRRTHSKTVLSLEEFFTFEFLSRKPYKDIERPPRLGGWNSLENSLIKNWYWLNCSKLTTIF